jgi:hypothetical protein
MPDFPFGGVMFVGHNTAAEGKRASHRQDGRSPGEPGNPLMQMWQKLYATFRRAAFNPQNEMFFTNFFVGLNAGDDQEGDFHGKNDSSFVAWCRSFLDEQIQIMKPRVIVTLGVTARDEFGLQFGQIVPSATRAGVDFTALSLHHPVFRGRQVHQDAALLRLATNEQARSEAPGDTFSEGISLQSPRRRQAPTGRETAPGWATASVRRDPAPQTVAWAKLLAKQDREAGQLCRQYKDFLARYASYGLVRCERVERLWKAYASAEPG